MLNIKKKIPRVGFPAFVLLGALLIAVLLIMSKPKPEPVQVQERAWLVSVQAAEKRTHSPQATLYGRLESLALAELRAAVAADVLAVEVVEGDRVHEGDLLVRLDEREARLNLTEREADVIDAEARVEAEKTRHSTDKASLVRERRLLQILRDEVKRLQDLLKKKLGSQSALDIARQAVERQAVAVATREQSIAEYPARMAQAEAALIRAGANRDQAELDLSRCTVRAPFYGQVAKRSIAKGRRVKVGDPLLTLYDDSQMVLRALIPERHLPALREAVTRGWPLGITGTLDGASVVGRFRGLVGEVDPASGGVPALFDVEAVPGLLQQGRFLEVVLTLPAQEDVIALPHEAVYGSDHVYLVDDDSRMRPVRVERLGSTRGDHGETLLLVRSAALREGARVVTTQLPNAVAGLLVRVSGGDAE